MPPNKQVLGQSSSYRHLGVQEVQNVLRSAWVKTEATSVCLNRRRICRFAGSVSFLPTRCEVHSIPSVSPPGAHLWLKGIVSYVHLNVTGVLQRALSRASSHIWFERTEAKDRALVTQRQG
jgi:hypothetical protein